jgi:hypothetical protein
MRVGKPLSPIKSTSTPGGEKMEKQANNPMLPERLAAMLGADPQRNGVPISGGERPETVPDARWDQSRRT